jgi:hypothetical protein
MVRLYSASVATLVFITLCGCAPEQLDNGDFRLVVVKDHLFGLLCQPRQEFYVVDASSRPAGTTYLGTCGTPKFVTDQLHMLNDPSCFAISEDGSSIVYLHRPELCGAGARATRKAAGVYLYAEGTGDRLLYASSQVSQVWGGGDIGRHAIRIQWIGSTPSRAGAQCAQTLVIGADGQEHAEGHPDPGSPMCHMSGR